MNLFHFFKRNKNTFSIKGSNNKVTIKQSDGTLIDVSKTNKHFLKKLNIRISGNSNQILIEEPFSIKHSCITINSASNARIVIRKNSNISSLRIYLNFGKNQHIDIGTNNSIQSGLLISCSESDTGLVTGNDCMFGSNIKIMCDDSHAILDKNSLTVINQPKNKIIIGDHCWICDEVFINKNSIIPSNSIIGARSVISTQFIEESTIIAGNPAKMIKQNVTWDRQNIITYSQSK